MKAVAQKNLVNPNVVNGKSSELLAREIQEAKMGEVRTVAEARQACSAKALEIIRALRTADPFYDGDRDG